MTKGVLVTVLVGLIGGVGACKSPNADWCQQTAGGCRAGQHCDENDGPTLGLCVPDVNGLGTGGSGGTSGYDAQQPLSPTDAQDAATAPTADSASPPDVAASDVGGIPRPDGGGADVLAVADALMDTPPAPTCTSGCNIGEKRCSATAVDSCMRMADGCGAWAISMPCASPRICSATTGTPSCVCQDECTDGARRCSAAGVETCEKVNGCLRWGKPQAFECSAGGRRCDSNGDAQECSSDGASCLAWKPLNKCNNFVCDRGICSDYECKSGYVKCGSECRPLLGACTVDTEHSIQGFTACSYNTGVRRYAKSNTPGAVRDECRAAILDLARTMCANLGANENWQGSWVAFKGNGLPLTGAEQMYGTCTPLAITTDAWDANVLNF
jgi:hypothetical protein